MENVGTAPDSRWFWGAVLALLLVTHLIVAADWIRLAVVRGILVLMAAGEGLGGSFGVFRPRWFAECSSPVPLSIRPRARP